MTIICGSKPYQNINFNNLIDNYYTKIYRINMNIPNNNSIYGKRNSNYQYLNLHVYEKYKNKLNLHGWISNYKLEQSEHIEKFYEYINNINNKNTFYKLNDSRTNNTNLINNILSKYNTQYRFKGNRSTSISINCIKRLVERACASQEAAVLICPDWEKDIR